jgi:hypothetical protein
LARVDGTVQAPTSSGSGTPVVPGVNPIQSLESAIFSTPTATPQPEDEDRGGFMFWLPICLSLLLLLSAIYWLYHRLFAKPQKTGTKTQKPDPRPMAVIPSPPTRPDDGIDAFHGIIAKGIGDKQGKNLKLRVSQSPNQHDVDEAFASGKYGQIKAWLDEADKDIFRVVADLVLEKKQDNLTGVIEQRKIGVLRIHGQDPEGRRGLLALTLKEIKEQAKPLGIQVLRAENVPADLQPQLQELGFEREANGLFTIKI